MKAKGQEEDEESAIVGIFQNLTIKEHDNCYINKMFFLYTIIVSMIVIIKIVLLLSFFIVQSYLITYES